MKEAVEVSGSPYDLDTRVALPSNFFSAGEREVRDLAGSVRSLKSF